MIVIEFDEGKQYRAGDKGVLAFRVTALEPGIEAVTIRLRWDDGTSEKVVRTASIPVGASRIANAGWLPPVAGEDVILLQAEVNDGRRIVASLDGRVSLLVQSATPASTHVNYTFQGESVRVMGVDMRANVGTPGESRLGRGVPEWRALDLHLRRRRSVALLEDVAPATTAKLTIEGDDVPGRAIHIASGPELRCGRHSSSDVVLRFLPVNAENNSRSEILSKSQFILSAIDGRVVATSGGGSSPTFVAGRRLRDQPVDPLPSGTRLTAGLMGLDLEIDVPQDTDQSAVAGHARILESLSVERGAAAVPPAVCLRRLNNEPSLSYLWLRSWATIGSGPDCAFHVARAHPRLARLHFANGRYFLESLAPGVSVVVAGDQLDAGAIRQLGYDEQIQIGATSLTWSLGR